LGAPLFGCWQAALLRLFDMPLSCKDDITLPTPYNDLDKIGRPYYIQNMTTASILLREIETMPEETAAQVLDFAMFIKSKHTQTKPAETAKLVVPEIKDAYGIFKDLKGMDTAIERDEEDRV
jgi:hypothetical protein